jgi:hypothetical protein
LPKKSGEVGDKRESEEKESLLERTKKSVKCFLTLHRNPENGDNNTEFEKYLRREIFVHKYVTRSILSYMHFLHAIQSFHKHHSIIILTKLLK